jgi:hypothetical protein
MRRGFVGFILLLFAGLLVPIGGFAEPLPIDNSPQFRNTIQDHQGHLHTLWVSQNGPGSSLRYQVTDTSGRLLAGPIVVSESSARIRRPQLAIDGRQIVHFLWQERLMNQPGQSTAIRYATLKLAPTGVALLVPHPVTLNHDRAATHPSLAVDRTGWAYAVWEIEGQDVILAAIDPPGHIGQIHHITREATKTDHALPVVAVDRRGHVHVVWSTQAGDKTQLVYKAFRGHGGQVLEKEKIVYTATGDVNQTKVVTFDPQGAVKVSWVNSQGRRAGQGRLARLGAPVGGGSLLIRHGRSGAASAVAAVVDQTLTAAPGQVWSVAGEAVLTPKPRLDAPAVDTESLTFNAIPLGKPSLASGDDAVSKLLMERLLRYATWSAAPPSQTGNTPAPSRLYGSSILSDQYLFIITVPASTALVQTNSHASELFPFLQGGDQIA